MLYLGILLEKAMATHSSTLDWKIPWMEEPGRLQSMGSLRVGHDWGTSLSLSCIGEGNGNPLQCSCLENPKDGGAWWVAVCGVAQSRTLLKRLSSSSSSSRYTFKNISWTCSLSLLDLFCLTFFKLGKMSTFLSLNSLTLFGVPVHTYK